MSKQANVSEQPKREFAVRVPKGPPRKLTIMKFNGSLNVKPENWTQEIVQLEREDNRRRGLTVAGEIVQDFGEGSVYGSAAREEARRKRLGRQSRKYEHDNQPWKLSIEKTVGSGDGIAPTEVDKDKQPNSSGKTRKFRSIREAGAGKHADYWIFYRAGNDLEAYKVDEWFQFLPAVTYKYLDAEQAEERFQQQSKVFNQFALKAQIQKQLAEQEERDQQGQMLVKNASGLKIKDEASSDEEYEADDEIEGKNGGDSAAKGRKKGKATAKEAKPKAIAKGNRKKQRVEAGDEVAAYESEDGEDEGREYDYMSDSGSDTDREELNVDRKLGEDLVGVEEEQGLKRSLETDEEGEEEEATAEAEEPTEEADEVPPEEQRGEGESRWNTRGAHPKRILPLKEEMADLITSLWTPNRMTINERPFLACASTFRHSSGGPGRSSKTARCSIHQLWHSEHQQTEDGRTAVLQPHNFCVHLQHHTLRLLYAFALFRFLLFCLVLPQQSDAFLHTFLIHPFLLRS
uniref:Transcription initiation factor IIF subunit alpha n=1 Tax=Globodera pallida TaxID=36090 RepID=A0A183C601_GLOPA